MLEIKCHEKGYPVVRSTLTILKQGGQKEPRLECTIMWCSSKTLKRLMLYTYDLKASKLSSDFKFTSYSRRQQTKDSLTLILSTSCRSEQKPGHQHRHSGRAYW